MAFQLKSNESVSAGIRRNVRNQIEKALEHLAAAADSGRRAEAQIEAVGQVRKCFKRVRAALRLVREELGSERYHEENLCFRDAARPLTQVRDAGILVETADKLREHFPKAMPPNDFAAIRRALLSNEAELRHRILEEDQTLGTVRDIAARALARLPDWMLEHDGQAALEAGIRRVYCAGHRARALAVQSLSVGDLHEWRKQTKYLWHQLQLLELALKGEDKGLIDKTHMLSTLLGEDHDLAVLRDTLAGDPARYGSHQALKGILVLIDRQREELERQAFTLGREIYKDPPRTFTNRILGSMREGTHEKREPS